MAEQAWEKNACIAHIAKLKAAIAESQQQIATLELESMMPSSSCLQNHTKVASSGETPVKTCVAKQFCYCCALKLHRPLKVLKGRKQILKSTRSTVNALTLSQPQCFCWTPCSLAMPKARRGTPGLCCTQPGRRTHKPKGGCRMFLKLATLVKGEHVLRIVDSVDKIVSMVENSTISEIGATN